MNIQNIPYKGVDYTKENYDESFPLLGCLHDQRLLSNSPTARDCRGVALGKRLQKQSAPCATALAKITRDMPEKGQPIFFIFFFFFFLISFCFCCFYFSFFCTQLQITNEQQTTRALHTFRRCTCESRRCQTVLKPTFDTQSVKRHIKYFPFEMKS